MTTQIQVHIHIYTCSTEEQQLSLDHCETREEEEEGNYSLLRSFTLLPQSEITTHTVLTMDVRIVNNVDLISKSES